MVRALNRASVRQQRTLTVTARDAAGNTSSDTLTVTANAAPTLAAIANQSSTKGLATTLQLTGNDPNGDPLTYSATGLPNGMTLAQTTGLVGGNPTTAGTFTVSASVSDGSFVGLAQLHVDASLRLTQRRQR